MSKLLNCCASHILVCNYPAPDLIVSFFPVGYFCCILSFLNCPEPHDYFRCFYWQAQSGRKGNYLLWLCYSPKALTLFVYFSRASRRCSVEMGDCGNTWQPTANLCYCYGFPLFMDPSIFKRIEMPSYLKNKECGIRVLTFSHRPHCKQGCFVSAALNYASVFMLNSHCSFFSAVVWCSVQSRE